MCAIFSPGEYPNDPNLVLWQDWGNILVPTEDILKILIFRRFLALQRSKFDHFCHFWPKFAFEIAENHQKIKIFKISSVGTKILPQSCHKTKFRSFGASTVEKIARKYFKKSFFWPIFHWNLRNCARSSQLWDVTTQQRENIFQFCKKFLNLHNPNSKICLNKKNLRLWPGPPLPP